MKRRKTNAGTASRPGAVESDPKSRSNNYPSQDSGYVNVDLYTDLHGLATLLVCDAPQNLKGSG